MDGKQETVLTHLRFHSKTPIVTQKVMSLEHTLTPQKNGSLPYARHIVLSLNWGLIPRTLTPAPLRPIKSIFGDSVFLHLRYRNCVDLCREKLRIPTWGIFKAASTCCAWDDLLKSIALRLTEFASENIAAS